MLSDSLAAGELDALIAYTPPRCFLADDPNVAPLFPHPVTAERDCFGRTGIFPIMHLRAVHRSLLERETWLARHLYAAFVTAAEQALKDLAPASAPKYCRSGSPRRSAIASLTRYSTTQGLTLGQLAVEYLFAADLLNT